MNTSSFRIVLWGLVCLVFSFQIAFAQDHQIVPWRHNHSGAVTIGFDDGLTTQVTNGVPALNARGLKATFFIQPGAMDVSWEQWRQVAAQGHEIGSHTVTHPDLTRLSDSNLRYELGESQRLINLNIPSQSCVSLAYPGNANNAYVQSVTSEYYVSGRAGWADLEGGDFNFYEDADPNWPVPPYVSLGSYKAVNFYDAAGDNAPFDMPLSNIDDKMDFAVAHHAWYDMYFHDIPDQASYINYFAALLDHILARNIWMGTYGEVAQYMRERMSSKLTLLSSDSSSIQLSLTNTLDARFYKAPLTLRSIVPSTWSNVSITQGTSSTTAHATVENGITVVYYDAVPNSGTIVLTEAGPLTAVSVNPAAVLGGVSSIGTVTMSAPAPEGGLLVSIASSDTTAAQVPDSVIVPAGATEATFDITTNPVATDTVVTISAAYNGASRTATLTVAVTEPAAALTGVSLSAATVQGGLPTTGTATLSAPAPTGGSIITLTSSNTAAAQVAASVTVPEGATTATFTVTTGSVISDQAVSITATYNSVSKTASLTVTAPAAALTAVSVSPATVQGGVSSTGTVALSAAAPPGGAVVSLTSSNTAAAQVPAYVTVAAGATTATFTITTSAVSSDTAVTITAVYNSVSKTAQFTVKVPVAALSSVALSPATVLGGASSTGTITLTAAAPASGAVITLKSGNTAAAQVPASVTVPAGEKTVTFTVTTTPVAVKKSVTITAVYKTVSRSATLAVTPPLASSLVLNPTSVQGGNPSTGTVTLTGPAPAGGMVVTLTSGRPAVAQVPASVTVPAGETTASFTITTVAVISTRTVTISAKRSTTVKAILTVTH